MYDSQKLEEHLRFSRKGPACSAIFEYRSGVKPFTYTGELSHAQKHHVSHSLSPTSRPTVMAA